MTSVTPSVDPFDVRFATDPHPRLAPFNLAGILGPADVHAARRLCVLVGEQDPDVLLAAALAVRAPQYSHVCIELSSVRDTVVVDEDAELTIDDLDWPDPQRWRDVLSASPLVRVRPAGTTVPDPREDRPLSLVEDRLYLDRYWRYERRVAEILRKRAGRTTDDPDLPAIRAGLDRLLPAVGDRPDRQRLAVASAFLRALTVISGGPGTGKTYTIARLLTLALELARDHVPRIAVAAPTGKAADRLTHAVRAAADDLDTSPRVRQRLRGLEASTIHRLLGWSPQATRFQHDRHRQLPHELVVVDETSMVDLPLMAKLLSALRTTTTLVLVGDPDQLASVEAGTVLSDVVGPAGGGGALRWSPPARDALEAATGEPLDAIAPARPGGIDDAVVTLGAAQRYDEASGIGRLAAAIHSGDADVALATLAAGYRDLTWVTQPVAMPARDADAVTGIRTRLVAAHTEVFAAATRGDAATALAALDRIRVLCAHRHGPTGVAAWVSQIERWVANGVSGYDPAARWYVGQPLLITQNDQRRHLFNGDVGVIIRDGDGFAAAFGGADGLRRIGPSRLEHVETVHAMTIHKSQGSEFDTAVVVLPDAESPILTRELLYTGVTRAREQVTVVGAEDVIRAAIERPVSRAAGLREALWGPLRT